MAFLWRMRWILFFLPLTLAVGGGRAVCQVSAPSDAAGSAALVQPGDQIVLRIWNEPAMSGQYDVGANGEVVLPKVGGTPVAGMTPIALQDTLRRAFATYLRNASVQVTVLRRIGVQGEVRRPDLYWVDLTMTLREVIARAGGITEVGNSRRVTIVRGEERLHLRGGNMSRFMTAELRSGDQIVVGRRSWFELNSLAIASTAAVVVGVMVPIVDRIRK